MINSSRIEFRPPDGVVPEGTEPGETFDLVTTYRLKQNGMVCIETMGDTDMPGYGKGGKVAKDYRKPDPMAMRGGMEE